MIQHRSVQVMHQNQRLFTHYGHQCNFNSNNDFRLSTKCMERSLASCRCIILYTGMCNFEMVFQIKYIYVTNVTTDRFNTEPVTLWR